LADLRFDDSADSPNLSGGKVVFDADFIGGTSFMRHNSPIITRGGFRGSEETRHPPVSRFNPGLQDREATLAAGVQHTASSGHSATVKYC